MIPSPTNKDVEAEIDRLKKVYKDAFWKSIRSNPLYRDFMARKRTINRKVHRADAKISQKRVEDIIEFVYRREWELTKKGQSDRWIPASEIVNKFWPKDMHRTAIVRILDDLAKTRTLERKPRVVKSRTSADYRLSVFHSQEDPEMIRKQREMEATRIIYLKLDAAIDLLKKRGCRDPEAAIADRIVDKWVMNTPKGRIPHYARKEVRDHMGRTRSTVVRLPI